MQPHASQKTSQRPRKGNFTPEQVLKCSLQALCLLHVVLLRERCLNGMASYIPSAGLGKATPKLINSVVDRMKF